MWYNKKPARPSMTSRLLKKNPTDLKWTCNRKRKVLLRPKHNRRAVSANTTYRSFLFLRRPWYLFAILNYGTKDFGNHFWIAGNVVRDSQTVMHTKSLRKKSAMVYGSTRGDRKFHCIIGTHRYDFSQEIPSHVYCFVNELGRTQSLP